MAFQHLGRAADALGELVEDVRGRAVQQHLDEDQQFALGELRVDQGRIAGDDAALAQAAHPLETG
ncbi:hypothetical protein D9M72_647250 [compost metagenome]